MSGIVPIDSASNLITFVTAVDERSFAAAGRKLGVSGSAVGKAIDRLETRLGASLLRRTTRSIALTREGELLYERSAQIIQDLREVEQAISQANGVARGKVRVSVPTVVGRRLVIPALKSFLEMYPQVEVELSLDDRIVDVVGESFDLVVRMGHLADSSLVARCVGPHRFVTCASPAYLGRRGVPGKPSDLRSHQCVRLRFPTTGQVEHWAFTADPPPSLREGLVLNDPESLRAAALSGLGIAQLPTYHVAEDLNSGRLRAVLEQYTSARGHIWLVRPRPRGRALRLRLFMEFLSPLLGGDSQSGAPIPSFMKARITGSRT